MTDFFRLVQQLRWDDHRYYHQCRINQSLHLASACCFLVAYALLPFHPALSGLIGWLLGMVLRQSGHLFFEPRGYDKVNHATDAHKEAIKVGFNMRRKAVLIGAWLGLPVVLWAAHRVAGGAWPAPMEAAGWWHEIGLMWLALGVAGWLFRTVHLVFLRGPLCALAWATKIVTDPFHNVALYARAPIALMHGQRYDPIATPDSLLQA